MFRETHLDPHLESTILFVSEPTGLEIMIFGMGFVFTWWVQRCEQEFSLWMMIEHGWILV